MNKNIFIIILIIMGFCFFYALDIKADNDIYAYVSYYEGDVTYYNLSDEEWEDISDSFEITENDMIKVGENAVCEITLKDGSIVTLDEYSQIEAKELYFKGNTKKIKFYTEYGNVNCLVEKLDNWRSSFQVESPVAVTGVRGTEFDVSYQEEDKVDVDVYDGEVTVDRVDESGKIVERQGISKDEAAEVYRNRDMKKLDKLHQNRKSLRDFIKARVTYGKFDRSLKILNNRISKMQQNIIKMDPENRKKQEKRLSKLYKSREKLTEMKNTKALHFENMKERIKKIRKIDRTKLAKLKKNAGKKIRERIKNMTPKQKQKLIKNRLRKLSPEQKKHFLKKHSYWEEKLKNKRIEKYKKRRQQGR